MGRIGDLDTMETGKLAGLLVVAGDRAADISNSGKLRDVVRGGVVRLLEELRVRPREGPAPRPRAF